MPLPLPEPFFLLDESLSSGIVAEVFRVTGYPISTVWDEWPGRDMSVNNLLDEEIVPHLGNKAGHRAVWITGDRKAFRVHGRLIDTHRISVLWLRGPGHRPLEPEGQFQMLCATMNRVHSLITQSGEPVYLRARLDPNDEYRPFLEQLQGPLPERPTQWHRLPLT